MTEEKTSGVLNKLAALLDEIEREKEAKIRGLGKSNHPTEDAPSGTHDYKRGPHAKYQSEKIKEYYHESGLDSEHPEEPAHDGKEKVPGKENLKRTYGDEQDKTYGSEKDVPPTKQTALAEHERQLGKYANMSLDKLAEEISDDINYLLAQLVYGSQQALNLLQETATKTAEVDDISANETLNHIFQKMGEEAIQQYAAGIQNQQTFVENEEHVKSAEDIIASILSDAEHDADLVGSYLSALHQSQLWKQAANGDPVESLFGVNEQHATNNKENKDTATENEKTDTREKTDQDKKKETATADVDQESDNSEDNSTRDLTELLDAASGHHDSSNTDHEQLLAALQEAGLDVDDLIASLLAQLGSSEAVKESSAVVPSSTEAKKQLLKMARELRNKIRNKTIRTKKAQPGSKEYQNIKIMADYLRDICNAS